MRFRTTIRITLVLEDLVAFVRYAHVAQLDFWSEHDHVDDLRRKLLGVDVRAVDVVGEEWDVE